MSLIVVAWTSPQPGALKPCPSFHPVNSTEKQGCASREGGEERRYKILQQVIMYSEHAILPPKENAQVP
jgi:hypothetical protein